MNKIAKYAIGATALLGAFAGQALAVDPTPVPVALDASVSTAIQSSVTGISTSVLGLFPYIMTAGVVLSLTIMLAKKGIAWFKRFAGLRGR